MTEAEWLDCTDPQKMLDFLRSKARDRKWRLFGVACCRRLWKLLPLDWQTLLEASERYSDEQATAGELYDLATHVHPDQVSQASHLACEAVRCCADLGYNSSRGMDERGAIALAAYYAGGAVEHGETATEPRERQIQSALLGDIFGSPFRPVALDPAWLTADVLTVAQAAYEHRTLPSGTLEPARLALLADALEDAGCDNAELLNHLRGEGPHVRGCWAVDLLLDKE